jgi:hypothetical protein
LWLAVLAFPDIDLATWGTHARERPQKREPITAVLELELVRQVEPPHLAIGLQFVIADGFPDGHVERPGGGLTPRAPAALRTRAAPLALRSDPADR